MKMISEAFGRRLESKGITRIQWIALFYLGEDGDISQRELSIKMKVKDSSCARLMDRMERDGLIKRVKSSEDRRVTFVMLTEKGKTMREELLPEGEMFSNELLQGISNDELMIFESVLNRMLNNVVK